MKTPSVPTPPAGDKLAKTMAAAGLCSRREAEEWIAQGRVNVNGKTETNVARRVNSADSIAVDGEVIGQQAPLRVWLCNKPRGLITTHRDPQNRPTLFEHLPDYLPRVISVGRLDLDSEGLILLTTSGPLARALELPSNQWKRTYRVRAFGHVPNDLAAQLAAGLTIDGVHYQPIKAEIDKNDTKNAWLTLTLQEGKNREIRRVLDYFGLKVNRLIRTAYGPFELNDLPAGTIHEVPRAAIHKKLGAVLDKIF